MNDRDFVPGYSRADMELLSTPLPGDLSLKAMEETWSGYQTTIAGLLMRMGRESAILDSVFRAMLVRSFEGVQNRLSLVPLLGRSAFNALERHNTSEMAWRVAGECSLMELSAAAGYRTFCLPDLVKGLLKTGKMKNRPFERMMDTFDFLTTMVHQPLTHPRVMSHIARTNGLHSRYRVAGSDNEAARDLFKYIALNMFYIGPASRPDISPAERHAICGLTVLVSAKMGHALEGSVNDFDRFIKDYEAKNMFSHEDSGILRQRAIEIAQASQKALSEIPTISPARIHGYVPYGVKRILELP